MESLNDALIGAIKALGGSKQVAPLLWPEKAPDAAQRLLLACLNEDRAERLSPDHLMMILRMARQIDYHETITHILSECSYGPPLPVEPEDEVSGLQREFVNAMREQRRIAERMEKLAAQMGVRAMKAVA